MNCRPLPYQGSALPLSYLGMFCLHGGERRIRTFEGFSRQIYSLIPLTAWVSPPGWSWQWDSNPQPADYKSAALPIELSQHRLQIKCERIFSEYSANLIMQMPLVLEGKARSQRLFPSSFQSFVKKCCRWVSLREIPAATATL